MRSILSYSQALYAAMAMALTLLAVSRSHQVNDTACEHALLAANKQDGCALMQQSSEGSTQTQSQVGLQNLQVSSLHILNFRK